MIENTKQLIEAWPLFTDEVRHNLLQGISTRGRFKGYVLANCPGSKYRAKAAAWNALVSNLAPCRVSLWGLISGDKAHFIALEKAVDNVNFRSCLNMIEPPQRWNLWHMNNVPSSLCGQEQQIVTEVVAKVQADKDLADRKQAAIDAGQGELDLQAV